MSDLPAILQHMPELGWTSAQVWAAYRVFGPSLGVFGRTLGSLSERYSERFLRIVERADAKLGDDAEEAGAISPRVVHKVLTDGIFSDDPVVHDYFAGLLAVSRSSDGEDDSAVPHVQMLARLSSEAIRLHYAIYETVNRGLLGGWLLARNEGRDHARTYIPFSAIEDWAGTRFAGMMPRLADIVVLLVRESLIEGPWAVGEPQEIQRAAASTYRASRDWTPPESGIIVQPSLAGCELALRSQGANDVATEFFLYFEEWESVPDIPPVGLAAMFPLAPTTEDELDRARQDAGVPSGVPFRDRGWAVPAASET